MKKEQFLPYLKRLLLVFLISVLAVVVISEVGIRIQNERSARAPRTVELVIPDGTAAKVDAGGEAPGIPKELTFVLGDTLLVRNEDSVTHTLGPLLVPAGASASLELSEPQNVVLSCSFAPSKYLGLNVELPTTLLTRFIGIGFAVPPTTAMLFVYSLLVFPVQPKPAMETPAPSES